MTDDAQSPTPQNFLDAGNQQNAPTPEGQAPEGTDDARAFDNLVQPAGLDAFKNPDGSYDVAKLSESYVALASQLGDTEKLRKSWQEDYEKALLSERPEKIEDYELPTLPEGFDFTKDIEENPMFEWWREQCYNNGKGQEAFQAGVQQFLGFMNDLAPNPKEELEKLGENAEARINAVSLWAQKTFPASEFQAIQILGTTAEGIAALERIAGLSRADYREGSNAPITTGRATQADLEQMMQDPRYHDPGSRDPEFVKKVEDGFRALRK